MVKKVDSDERLCDYKGALKNSINIKLYNFCNNVELQSLELNGYDSCARKYIHERCDQLNVEHESVGPAYDRKLILTKTKNTSTKNVGEIK